MKKITGKALSLVLSLALVVSSFSGTFASAATSTINGSLSGDDTPDEIYLVNGGTGAGLTDPTFGLDMKTAAGSLLTDQHKDASDWDISSIAHASGDRLVKWFDTKDSGSIDTDTGSDVTLALRNSSVSGTETLNILYKGTWTDDNDKEYSVKATQTVTVRVYDKYQTVVGEIGTAAGDEGELDDTFAQKTLAHEIKDSNDPTLGTKSVPDTANDTRHLAVLRAVAANPGVNATVGWDQLNTAVYSSSNSSYLNSGYTGPVQYLLKSTSDNIKLIDKAGTVDAVVANDASTGSATFTAQATAYAKDQKVGTDSFLFSSKDVKEKTSVDKKIIVNSDAAAEVGFTKFGKYSGSTYLYNGVLDSTTYKDNTKALKVNGFAISFKADGAGNVQDISVLDNAVVTKISGDVKSINVSSGTVTTIDVDDSKIAGSSTYNNDANISVDEGKVDSIDTDGNVQVTSPKSVVGTIKAAQVDVTSGKTGNIDAPVVSVKATDDDTAVTVGDIKATTLDIDSQDSSVTTGAITSKDADGVITLSGSDVTIKSLNYDYRNTNLEFADFQGTIPAPTKASADGAAISTTDANDKVVVSGDTNINSISIEDETQLTFTGALTANNIDGSGTLVVGLNKLYVSGSASGVILKLSDPFKVGDVAFTALSDTVDESDLDTYGFTVAKTAGSSKDTFKVADVSFVGLTIAPAAAQIAKGYSQTFTASAYAPGTSIPAGYKVQFSLDGAGDTLELVDNGNNTATVSAVNYDESFSSENKATLKAELVDADGNVDEDYSAGEADVSAILTPAVVSDTTSDFSLAPGASYQFKITSATQPVLTAGTAGVFSVSNVGKSGNDYFIKITAIGKAGNASGIYVNGTKLLVATIKSDVKSDTTKDITVKKGASYTYKITTSAAPTFGIGTGGVFTYKLTGHNGNDYFYQITAVGAAGAKAGIYVNGQKINVATIG